MPRNPNCEACVLHEKSKNVCIWGHGDGAAFVIGEAPGREEAKLARPFVGESGRVLRAELAKHNLADAYVTNVVKCQPPKNRKPEREELAACRVYLEEEITTRNPKAILLLGATAMKSMIRKTGITEMNGQVLEKDGQKYVCCFHPAYILRDPSKHSAFSMAIGRYAAVMNDTHDETLPLWRAVDGSTFDQFILEYVQATEASFDTETTGLDWWVEGFDINSIQFSLHVPALGERNWVIPMAKWPILKPDERAPLLKWLSENGPASGFSAQNGKFDNLCLMRRFGVRFPLTFDTMLAHHLIDENSAHGLKILSRQFLGAPDYDISLKEKLGDTNRKKFFTYAAADAAYTRRLVAPFRKKMDEEDRWIFEKLTMPAARAFERIEANGLYMDLDKIAAAESEQLKAMAAVEKQLNRIAGKHVNWNAPEQVAEILYGKLGLTPTVFTDKKAPSTGEEALADIEHPIAKLLEKYREHKKFLSTYIGDTKKHEGGWQDFMVGPHLYLGTKLHGTVTGRYSSRLHQVPREGLIRSLNIAPPGWEFGQLDLSQAELKVIAVVSHDPEMLRCFKEGIDIHWRTLIGAVETGGGEYVDAVWDTAKKLTKKKLDFPDALDLVRQLKPEEAYELWDGWKEGRKKAKGINFGFSYGQSADGFIHYAKTKYGFTPTLEESTNFREGFFGTYLMLQDWHERQKKLVRQDGYVRNLIGRKRHLPGIYSSDRFVVSECERMAINAPIQGFIGDYKAMILIEVDAELPWDQFRVVGEVHDSILFWVRSDVKHLILPQVKAIADAPKLAREAELNFPIPLNVDIEIGPWGAGKRWRPS